MGRKLASACIIKRGLSAGARRRKMLLPDFLVQGMVRGELPSAVDPYEVTGFCSNFSTIGGAG